MAGWWWSWWGRAFQAVLRSVRRTKDQDTWSSREGLVWFWRAGRDTCKKALLRLGLNGVGTALPLEM